MSKNYSQFDGKELWDVVQQAVNSQEFKELNKQVKRVVAATVDQASRAAQAAADQAERAAQIAEEKAERERMVREQHARRQREAQRQYTTSHRPPAVHPTQAYQALPAKSALYKAPSKAGGLAMSITGFSLAAIMGCCDVACLMGLLTLDELGGLFIAGIVFFSLLTAGGLWLGFAGRQKSGLVTRFRQYMQVVGSRTFCSVAELSSATGMKAQAVVKDLKKMIDQRFFVQARLDNRETHLFLTQETYQQFLLTEKNAAEKALEQRRENEKLGQLPAAVREIISEGQEYIRFIRDMNDKLPGDTISTKLDRLELIITHIFAEVEKNPDLAADLRKFMNYYLPTTRKLIQTYYEIEQDPVSSDAKRRTKQEIEDTLDTINSAFETLLDGFFADKALDISADISVLNTMLTQEGLTSTFDINAGNAGNGAK